jgi:glycerol-3-phosphate dehydrogenase (NAD(P)+)
VQNVAVLGAGYMGSAITFPLTDNGINVNLWGTWLDDKLIEGSRKGIHPKLKKPLNPGVSCFYSRDLKQAIKDTDTIFIGVVSEGFVNIFELLMDNIEPGRDYMFLKLTKGLVEYEGRIMRASEAAKLIYHKKFPVREKSKAAAHIFSITSIGGPVRALDLANRTLSASVYGVQDRHVKSRLKRFSTDYYRILPASDYTGVEICSTFKNIYSIAAGICDGLFKKNLSGLYHNAVAFLFNQAVLEIKHIVSIAGGKPKTAFSLAGMGDLHVTSVAGRNRRYGEMVGSGAEPGAAFKKMFDEGEYGEGYTALKLAVPWLSNFNIKIAVELPLLNLLYNIVLKGFDPDAELKVFASNFGI